MAQSYRKFLILFIISLLVSCAAYQTYNQTTKGKIFITGGVYQDHSWDDSMVLRRASWYHGMTLHFDALFYPADENSPFAMWFSIDEKDYFKKCDPLLVSVTYSSDPRKIPFSLFKEQMMKNGFDDIVLNHFGSYLENHATYKDWNLGNYRIAGFCKRHPTTFGKENEDKILVNFPSFSQLVIHLEK